MKKDENPLADTSMVSERLYFNILIKGYGKKAAAEVSRMSLVRNPGCPGSGWLKLPSIANLPSTETINRRRSKSRGVLTRAVRTGSWRAGRCKIAALPYAQRPPPGDPAP